MTLKEHTEDWHIEFIALETLTEELNTPIDNTQENMVKVLSGEHLKKQHYLESQILIAKGHLHDLEYHLAAMGATPKYLEDNHITPTSLAMTYFEKNLTKATRCD